MSRARVEVGASSFSKQKGRDRAMRFMLLVVAVVAFDNGGFGRCYGWMKKEIRETRLRALCMRRYVRLAYCVLHIP